MKIEIEITEADIKSAIERKIRVAIADETNAIGADAYIRERVKAHWKAVADKCIQEALSNAPELSDKITKAIESKIRGQVTAALKGIK